MVKKIKCQIKNKIEISQTVIVLWLLLRSFSFWITKLVDVS